MKPHQHEQVATAICRAHQDYEEQGRGRTAYLNTMEDLVDTLADILAADNRSFDRTAFIAKCGLPKRD